MTIGPTPLAPCDFPIVGVVSSAGGLDAIKRLFSAAPPAPGAAFVVVPHLDPGRDSMPAEVIARHTPMSVVEATDGATVAPDHVYLIPPNATMQIRGGVLRLSPPDATSGTAGSLDDFLTSLAEDAGNRAVGVVLSGTAPHGSRGLRAIKAHGGRTVAQEPATAAFPSMPQAAIDAGLADAVLAPELIPAALNLLLEKLPSTVEGRETSKEEIQALNEDPTTTNAQLREKDEALPVATAEVALRRNRDQRRLATVLMGSADAIVLVEADGRISAWNHGAGRMYGYTEAEAIGLAFEALVPASRRVADLAALDAVRRGETRPLWETQRTARDGRILNVSVTASLLGEGDERPPAVNLIERDQTERKRLECEVLEIASAEQDRIGRELHDSVGQELTGLRLMTETLIAGLRDQNSHQLGLAVRISKGLRDALGRVRQLSRGLVAAEVSAAGLVAELQLLAAHIRETSAVGCTFETTGPVPTARADVATHLLRIAQEAVANAIRHADPKRITIALIVSERATELRVRDDGRGFVPPPDTAPGGIGLKLMRYRAGCIGATLHIGTGPTGTLVTCSVPQEPAEITDFALGGPNPLRRPRSVPEGSADVNAQLGAEGATEPSADRR